MRAALLALLLLAAPARAQDAPPLHVPERVTVRAGALGKLRAEVEGAPRECDETDNIDADTEARCP